MSETQKIELKTTSTIILVTGCLYRFLQIEKNIIDHVSKKTILN